MQDALFDAQQNVIDLDQLAQLQKLAKNKRLKLLELNQTNNMNGHSPPMSTFGQGQYGNIGGGSSSRGPAPYGNGSGGCGPATKNVHPCCHAFEFSCGGNRWGEEKAQRPLLPPNCDPTGPMPTYNHGLKVQNHQITTLLMDRNR